MAVEGSKKSQASASLPPRKINLQKFADSRAAELESLHSAVSARLNNDFRSRRNKRRRTTAFDNQASKKRNRKRQRLTKVDKINVSGLETEQKKNESPLPRRVRRRMELKKNPESGFVTSGDGTKRLRTHVWHAKRFTMAKRWGFYLPLGLQGRGRGSRAVLRWFKQGVLLHDASYNLAVQLEGPEDSLVAILEMVMVPSTSVKSDCDSGSVLSGVTYGTAMLHHVGAPYSQPIAPVNYMWHPHRQSKEEGNNNCLDVVKCNEPCRVNYSSCFCQLWVWIHASAFCEGYDTLKCACEKLMIDRGVTINCFSREGQLAKLELIGCKAFQLLQKTVHPDSCIVDSSWQLQKCSAEKDSVEFQNEEHIRSCAILSFTIKDPRLLPAKETVDFREPDSIIDVQEVGVSECVNLTENLDKKEELGSLLCPKAEGNENLSDNNLWDASSRIDPPEEENELCMEKHQQRMGFFCLDDPKSGPPKTSNKVQCSRSCPILLLKNNNKKGSPIGWSVILPLSWTRVFWSFLVSKGAHVIGLREKRWIAGEIGLPYFPSDFPDCHSYLSLNEIEAAASRENAERRPPAVRPFRIPIPSPWNVVHVAFDKLTMRVNEAAKVSSGENIVGTSSCERSDVTSFRSRNSFDAIVARTSSMLTGFLNGIQGEHLLIFPQLQNRNSSLVKVMKDKSMMEKGQNGTTQISYRHKLCFVRVHLHAYKEGVFEEGAVICAPSLTDISIWTSSIDSIEGGLEMPNSAVGSYFKEQPSGKWELQEPDDPASIEYHRWPVGFVTTGFVRGSKKPTAVAYCEAVLLACLREEQWKEMAVKRRRKEIYVLVRNLRSSAYRLALATIVLEQQEEDVRFL
ncbi:ribonucleases P/MRP protein subunit POP1-like isoform X1 [Hibiscus syriacus]|uniref:ribonucleases P/MRP protein subunit POP1-like isoform X1 n=1 Tax=Hibiscus syriacus TaxID=106335 RepID=UPI0019221E53|nr:ribonucleases P/MRP protein subunit POP1-like isoform X1 [Hibiscus syriacus]